MKAVLAIAALVASLSASAVTRTYLWHTNLWQNAPEVNVGRVVFTDGTWVDSMKGMGAEPEYLPNGKTAINPVTGAADTRFRNVPLLFANGRAIQIEADTNDQRKAIVSWAQYTKIKKSGSVWIGDMNRHTMSISCDTVVFAGSDGTKGTDPSFCNGSVSLFGGRVAKIYGGCWWEGVLATSTITVGPGSQVTEIYGGNEGGGRYGSTVPAGKVNRSFVGAVTIRIHMNDDDAPIDRVAGGGHSVADVATVDILMTGGRVKILTIGSTSGMVGYSKCVLNGGYVTDFAEMWSRGYTGGAEFTMNGGDIRILFAGGDPRPDTGNRYSDATAGWCTMNLLGGTVQSLQRGLNVTAVNAQRSTASAPFNVASNYNENVSGTYRKGVVRGAFDPDVFHLTKDDAGIDRELLLGPDDPDDDPKEFTGAGFAQKSFLTEQQAAWMRTAGRPSTTNDSAFSVDTMYCNRTFDKIRTQYTTLQRELDMRPAVSNAVGSFLMRDNVNTNILYDVRISGGSWTILPLTTGETE